MALNEETAATNVIDQRTVRPAPQRTDIEVVLLSWMILGCQVSQKGRALWHRFNTRWESIMVAVRTVWLEIDHVGDVEALCVHI